MFVCLFVCPAHVTSHMTLVYDGNKFTELELELREKFHVQLLKIYGVISYRDPFEIHFHVFSVHECFISARLVSGDVN